MDIKIYFKPYHFDENVPINTSKDYVVWADGAIILKTNNLQTAEKEYTKQCKKYYDDVHGEYGVGKHIIHGGVIKTLGEEI